MTVFDLIKKIETTEIDSNKINMVEAVYGEIYSDTARKLISVKLGDLEDRQLYSYYQDAFKVRLLSPFEMVANKDFIEDIMPDKALVPFIIWGELDIICYDTEEDEWVDLETESCEIAQSEVDFIDVARTLHEALPDVNPGLKNQF